ncbi:hypothetical protein RUM43_006774 [Polyplax serrata]|uniref:Uncharacterized protein n=1 Tax=Polyplax serrata TaxID=468196 RepID=A0AAN8S7G0_POLSC
MNFFNSRPKLDSSSCSKDLHYTARAMDSAKSRGKVVEAYDPSAKKEKNCLIKPITRQNLLYHYVPLLGTASYTVLSISVLNPSLRYSYLPKRDVTNILLATALFGTGCYLYSRPHIKDTSKNGRYGFSALGSVMFNFSSVLLWAILRSVLPENVAICSAAGLASSYVLVQGATNYIQFVDNKSSI